MIMKQQRLPPFLQPPSQPPTTIVQPHHEVLAPMVLASKATITIGLMHAPLPLPPKPLLVVLYD